MNFEKKIRQYGVLIVGLLIGGGFAFGGIASYAGLINSGGSSGDQQKFNATVPEKNFSTSSYGLDMREQVILARYRDVVFVNGFYSTPEQKQQMMELRQVPQRFNRVYVNLINSSNSNSIKYRYGLTEYPRIVVIGGNRNYRPAPISDISVRKVSSAVCQAFRNLNENAGACIG